MVNDVFGVVVSTSLTMADGRAEVSVPPSGSFTVLSTAPDGGHESWTVMSPRAATEMPIVLPAPTPTPGQTTLTLIWSGPMSEFNTVRWWAGCHAMPDFSPSAGTPGSVVLDQCSPAQEYWDLVAIAYGPLGPLGIVEDAVGGGTFPDTASAQLVVPDDGYFRSVYVGHAQLPFAGETRASLAFHNGGPDGGILVGLHDDIVLPPTADGAGVSFDDAPPVGGYWFGEMTVEKDNPDGTSWIIRDEQKKTPSPASQFYGYQVSQVPYIVSLESFDRSDPARPVISWATNTSTGVGFGTAGEAEFRWSEPGATARHHFVFPVTASSNLRLKVPALPEAFAAWRPSQTTVRLHAEVGYELIDVIGDYSSFLETNLQDLSDYDRLEVVGAMSE